MANEGERSTAADKGKGKVEDVSELNGKKPQNDDKTATDGKKKDDEPQEGKFRLHRANVLRSRACGLREIPRYPTVKS